MLTAPPAVAVCYWKGNWEVGTFAAAAGNTHAVRTAVTDLLPSLLLASICSSFFSWGRFHSLSCCCFAPKEGKVTGGTFAAAAAGGDTRGVYTAVTDLLPSLLLAAAAVYIHLTR